jgi:DNA replication protein DnaC
MQTQEIMRLTSELRLAGIRNLFEARCLQAQNEGMPHNEFLSMVLEDEKLHRKNNAAKKLEAKAKFRNTATLESWDSTFERGISKQKIKEFLKLGFWADKKNLVFVGQTGAGKTQLAISIGRVACASGLSVAFISTNRLFEESQAVRASGKYLSWFKQLCKNDIIIFDDFGLREYTHDEAMILLDLLEERYQKGMQIITSQVDIEGWQSLFADKVASEAIVDRLKNPSEKVVLTGPSYRGRIKS